MSRSLTVRSALTLALLSITAAAGAAPYVEVGDAGQTLATAQAVSPGTSKIQGTLASGSADLFSFFWGGGSFYVNSTGTTWDSQLFLFNASGQGVWGNDDGISNAGPAYIADANLAAGQYFLAISGYDYDPYSAQGLMFQSSPYGQLYGPSNSGTLTHWASGSSQGSGGAYVINFQRITSDGTPVGDPTPIGNPVPAPGTLALAAVALLAGVGSRRARRVRGA